MDLIDRNSLPEYKPWALLNTANLQVLSMASIRFLQLDIVCQNFTHKQKGHNTRK